MWKLKNTANTPPKGFRWIDPITNMEVHAQNFDNWMTKATDHRVANALPLVEREEMEDQLCRGYTENMRKDVCSEYDSSGIIKRLGVGSTLKAMLAAVGVSACWGCTKLAERMDSWGPDGCEANMPEIVATMSENATKSRWTKYLPFKEMGAEALVRIAIGRVREQSLLFTETA